MFPIAGALELPWPRNLYDRAYEIWFSGTKNGNHLLFDI